MGGAEYLCASIIWYRYLYTTTSRNTRSTNPPTDAPIIIGIILEEVEDEDAVEEDTTDEGMTVLVGSVVGALVGGNTNTRAEVAPSEVAFTLAATLAPRATDAIFKVRVKLPDEKAAAS